MSGSTGKRTRRSTRISRRENTFNRHVLHQLIAAALIPGGCDDCDAYQTVDPSEGDVIRLTVHHDDTCPWWRIRQAAR